MKRRTTIAALGTTALITIAQSAYASVIENTVATAEVFINSVSVDSNTDSMIAIANGTETFLGNGPPGDVATGSASQTADGFSTVEANVSYDGTDAFAASGDNIGRKVDSVAILSTTYTNTSTTDSFAGTFDFSVAAGFLETNRFGGFTPSAAVQFTVSVNGTREFLASATLFGNPSNPALLGSGFSGTVMNTNCFGSTCATGTVNLDTLTGAVDLGTLAPGEDITVETTLYATNSWSGVEVGSTARLGDPNAASFSASFSQVGMPAVPLPAGMVLMLSALGLGGVAASRRKRKVA